MLCSYNSEMDMGQWRALVNMVMNFRNNKHPTYAVLTIMRMIEVSSGVGSTELVAEVRLALYGALCYHRDAVHVRKTALKLAMPVQGRLQASQVTLHVHNNYISLTNLQPSEPTTVPASMHCNTLQRYA
jgi:hypothetical protein